MAEPKQIVVPAPTGQEAAFEKYGSMAEALAPTALKVRGDALLARENFSTGLERVVEQRSRLEEAWGKARVSKLLALADLPDGVVFAASRAEQLDVSEGKLRALVSEGYDGRDKLLSVLDMAAKFGLVPPERVAKLREGSGPIDAGQDLVDGVAVVREHQAALASKTPLTSEVLEGMARLGNELTVKLKPGDAKERENPTAKEAATLANRYWTLLVQAHAELRKAGFELWGEGVDAWVPPLQSRRRASSAKPAEPTPA